VNGGGTLSNDGASTVYDFDEGIRKHSQHVYGPVLSLLVQQPQTMELLESLEKDKDRERYFEDYKKEHQMKMNTWKMQSV
jgi:hypothetical protein